MLSDRSNRAAFLKAAGLSVIAVPALAGMGPVKGLHSVRHVFGPDSKLPLPDKLATIPDYSQFVRLLGTTPTLYNKLETGGPYTVFPFSDEAYNKLTASQQTRLNSSGTFAENVLDFHVINGSYMFKDLQTGQYMTLLCNQTFRITKEQGEVFVNHALINRPNIGASNGFAHGINKVLMRGFRVSCS